MFTKYLFSQKYFMKYKKSQDTTKVYPDSMNQTPLLVHGFGMVKNTNEVSSQLYLAAFPASK